MNRNWVAKNIVADPEWDDVDRQERLRVIAELFGIDDDMFEDVVTTEFIDGFLEGAADVWNQVEDEI